MNLNVVEHLFFDEERPGRPADVVIQEIIEKVHDTIPAYSRTQDTAT